MSEIILLAGGIGSGKAYIMNKLLMEKKETGNNIFCLSFADPIKRIVKDVFGYDKNGKCIRQGANTNGFDIDFHFNQVIEKIGQMICTDPEECLDRISIHDQEELKESIKFFLYTDKSDLDNLKILIRNLMQLIGTEIGQSVKKDIWPSISANVIDCIQESGIDFASIDYIIIDDWRFLFEYFTLYFNFQHEHKITPYYITASPETRARRRKISVDELIKQSQHYSERESNDVIINWMKIYFPNNIIVNEG